MMFAFDWGARALVYPSERGPASISVGDLFMGGWKFNEAELRKILPRADASRLASFDTRVGSKMR